MPSHPQQVAEPGSFRDREGRVFYYQGAVYRGLSATALEHWQAVSSAAFFQRAVQAGRIIGTELVNDGSLKGEWAGLLRHEAIPFISYPYEWTFSMLREAALLQLELLAEALADNVICKDATSYNVQWMGSRPVFIDVPSFERMRPGQVWVGYRQFCQLFLYPLMLQAYKGVEFQPWLRGALDGPEPEQMNRLMSWRDLLRPGVFSHVWLQSRLSRRFAGTQADVGSNLQQAGFQRAMIEANVKGLLSLVRRLHWSPPTTVWSEYTENTTYAKDEDAAKEAFVKAALERRAPALVWDLGANTGRFSRLAAAHARYVVAMDADQPAVERLYLTAREQQITNLLPLVTNLANPSPGLGWRGLERKPLLARGSPDLILCLALIHHAVIAANVPLREFVEWLRSLQGAMVIEFVTRDDSQVKTLLRNKQDNYSDYETEYFERCMEELYSIERRQALSGGTRILYYVEPKA